MPTLRRPDSLARAVRSVFAQTDAGPLELVVVDNSPEGSAGPGVQALAAEAPFPLRFVHEATPGVATARNSGLAVASGELVAFLDDDEEAPPGWLAALVRVHREHGADVTFGPIRGRAPDGSGWATAYLERLFSRTGPAQSGPVSTHWGCGNSLLTRSTALAGPAPFDPAMDQIGGEDDLLFTKLAGLGRRFAWAAEAWVWEHPAPHRATLTYAVKRAFAYGQGPSQTASYRGDRLAVARWMAIGAMQTAVFGAAAAALWLLRRPERADMLDRAARGLGKVLWMPRFEPRFYGAAEVARSGGAAL
ncbi:MAG: glycosyltransferase [Proteobacteria bacterium]|nr:glycosyltransferase [Pseudomonadota bacterium]